MRTEDWIRELIGKGELWRFYKSKEWRKLKADILKESHHECAECKKLGKVTRHDIGEDGTRRLLSTVHHVMHVREHPELALSRFYYQGGERRTNLIPVCKACHNRLHPEKRKREGKAGGFTNVERW